MESIKKIRTRAATRVLDFHFQIHTSLKVFPTRVPGTTVHTRSLLYSMMLDVESIQITRKGFEKVGGFALQQEAKSDEQKPKAQSSKPTSIYKNVSSH